MKTKHAPAILLLVTIIAFAFLNLTFSFAETINYIYDDLHRLIRVENTSNGSAVEYQYDAVGNRTQRTVTNAGIQLRITVRKDAQSTLQGVNTYLFNDSGSYLGQAQITDAGGVATFNVSPGAYNVRADYLGYQFWTGTVQVSGSTSIDLVIPHHTVNIAVNRTFQGTSTPLSGVNVYVFTPDGSYLGLSQQTGADGRVCFSLPDRDYKVRADYLGQQYFSAVFHAQDAAVNIPMADAQITVIQGNQPVNGIKVYIFTPDGSYLGISGVTDASGKVTFRLPVASYKFRADYLGSQYWSSVENLTANQLKQITINTGGGQFSLTVLKDTSHPLTGVSCYAFNVGGSYLGLSGVTSSSGQVTYNLSDGNYKFRIDYLGYQFWSDVVTVPTAMSVTKTIPHQSVNITVTGSLAGNNQPKANVRVYLFNPSGSYLGIIATTNSSGRASFNVPQQAFKVRADYLGQQYWSDVFTWADKTIVIPEGTAHVHVTVAGQDVPSVPVYVFNSTNAYLGISGTTDATGVVEFRLPAGSYKFRADYQGGQYWATATINHDVVNTVELSMGGGVFTLTIDKGSGPLTGVRVYAFNSGGSYLGLYKDSNASGQASFNLADGSYKFRVDYLGYQFWSDVYTVPTVLSGTLSIPCQNITITVEGAYQGSQPIAGVNVYLFTPSGSYLGLSQVTDGSGHATFSLPNKSYKVRADYLGSQFWSSEFQFQNATVSIQRGVAQIIAKKSGTPVSGVPVYAFSGSGSYRGLSATTNADGKAEFLLPNLSYKFRVDEGGAQHWSAVTAIAAGQVNPIEVTWD